MTDNNRQTGFRGRAAFTMEHFLVYLKYSIDNGHEEAYRHLVYDFKFSDTHVYPIIDRRVGR